MQRVGVRACRRGKETRLGNSELRIGGLRLRFWMGGAGCKRDVTIATD